MQFPYATYDVTSFMPRSGDLLVAVQGLGPSGGKSTCPGECAGGGPKIPHGVLVQLQLTLEGGGSLTVVTDSSWQAFDADVYMRPSPGKNWYKHVLEKTDAQHEPQGWRSETQFAAGAGWTAASPVHGAAGLWGLHPKMSRSVEVLEGPAPVLVQKMAEEPGWFLVDFGREFQGGLRLSVTGATAGMAVSIDAGESRYQTRNRSYTGPVHLAQSPSSRALLCVGLALFKLTPRGESWATLPLRQ